MDAYGKQVYFELKSLREKAEDEHLAALVALNAAIDAHGPYMANVEPHPVLKAAYARQEAAELVEYAVTKLVADWLAIGRGKGGSATARTVAIIEGSEVAYG
jgi:hypothetical protein